jgi:hypothetical protein
MGEQRSMPFAHLITIWDRRGFARVISSNQVP